MNSAEIIDILVKGGIILYPTDTIWGIGCDATNEEACQRIFDLKKRPTQKSFIVLMDGIPMLEKYVPDFHPVCYDLIDLATSPLTIIYPSAKGLAKEVLAENGSVGIRITKDPNCLELIRKMKKPLVSTSANISGLANPQTFKEIDTTIKMGVDGILDIRLEENMTTPSKIIQISLNGSVKVIRG
jgi:L-threonylcarbamoyladenylate synthase